MLAADDLDTLLDEILVLVNAGFIFKTGIDEDEDLIQQCIEVIRSEQKASVSLLQRRLRLGYTRAARIMDELESRGIVGPGKGAEPRDILIDLDGTGMDGGGQEAVLHVADPPERNLFSDFITMLSAHLNRDYALHKSRLTPNAGGRDFCFKARAKRNDAGRQFEEWASFFREKYL